MYGALVCIHRLIFVTEFIGLLFSVDVEVDGKRNGRTVSALAFGGIEISSARNQSILFVFSRRCICYNTGKSHGIKLLERQGVNHHALFLQRQRMEEHYPQAENSQASARLDTSGYCHVHLLLAFGRSKFLYDEFWHI